MLPLQETLSKSRRRAVRSCVGSLTDSSVQHYQWQSLTHRLLRDCVCLCARFSAASDHDVTSPAAEKQLAVSSEQPPPPQASLRRHKEKAQPRLVGMGEKPLVLAQLRSEDYLSYYASSYSKARRDEPPAQKKAISNHRFMLQFSDAHDHVCIRLAARCSAVI